MLEVHLAPIATDESSSVNRGIQVIEFSCLSMKMRMTSSRKSNERFMSSTAYLEKKDVEHGNNTFLPRLGTSLTSLLHDVLDCSPCSIPMPLIIALFDRSRMNVQ